MGKAKTPNSNVMTQWFALCKGNANKEDTRMPIKAQVTNIRVSGICESWKRPPKTPGASDHARPLQAPKMTTRVGMLFAPNI